MKYDDEMVAIVVQRGGEMQTTTRQGDKIAILTHLKFGSAKISITMDWFLLMMTPFTSNKDRKKLIYLKRLLRSKLSRRRRIDAAKSISNVFGTSLATDAFSL